MSRLQALVPSLAFYPALCVLAVVMGNALWHRCLGPWRRGAIAFLAAWIAVVLLSCVAAPRSWLRVARDRCATSDVTKTWETAVVFGFGYTVGPNGRMLPGPANKALLDWVTKHTVADTLIVQEGVWAAACETAASECVYQGRRLVRMHRHDPEHYVNTLGASVCALEQLRLLQRTRALVVAHDLQLARALMAMHRAAGAEPAASGIELAAPDLPPTPFVPGGAHPQTAHAWLYKPIELLIARPRDALFPLPRPCGPPRPAS